MFSTLFTCALLVVATSAGPLTGSCPDPKTVTTFNATKFSGLWFDALHTQRNTGLQLSCDQVKFETTTPTKLSFVSASYSAATKNNILAAGDAEIQNFSGKLSVSMAGFNKSEVLVLATDYQTYAVLWSCQNKIGTHTERTLVLTRDKHPSSNVITTAKKSLENNNISKSTLHESAQHKCPQYNFSDTSKTNSSLSYGTSMGSLLTSAN